MRQFPARRRDGVDPGSGHYRFLLAPALERRELLLYREGISTTIAVVRSPTAISLSVNGKTDASNTRDMATQLLLGHL